MGSHGPMVNKTGPTLWLLLAGNFPKRKSAKGQAPPPVVDGWRQAPPRRCLDVAGRPGACAVDRWGSVTCPKPKAHQTRRLTDFPLALLLLLLRILLAKTFVWRAPSPSAFWNSGQHIPTAYDRALRCSVSSLVIICRHARAFFLFNPCDDFDAPASFTDECSLWFNLINSISSLPSPWWGVDRKNPKIKNAGPA